LFKKILGSCIAALILLCLAAGGTWAYFKDTESTGSNTFSADTLDLQVGLVTQQTWVNDIAPGSSGNTSTWILQNSGSLAGNLSVLVSPISNIENGVTEVEHASGESPSNTVGDLGGLLKFSLWMDVNDDGWSDGDYYLDPSGTNLTRIDWASGEPLGYFNLDLFGSKTSPAIQNLGPNSIAGYFKADYLFPDGGIGDNYAQTDSCSFNLTFYLAQ
jgi:predicted ribosomally synthesized peptide with SipW-like signal peptide